MLLQDVFIKYLKSINHPGKVRLTRLLGKLFRLDSVRAQTQSGILMDLYYHEYVQNHILMKGNYEINSIHLLKNTLKSGDIFLDIGAHVGQYSLEAAKIVGVNGKVIALEPNPKTFECLLNNIRINNFVGIVLPILGAASKKYGLIGMELPSDDNWGRSREATSHTDYYAIAMELDDLLRQMYITRIDFMKLDVEGAELDVLEGLLETDTLKPRSILFEYIPDHFSKSRDVVQYLLSKGYELFDVNGIPFDFNAAKELPDCNLLAKLNA